MGSNLGLLWVGSVSDRFFFDFFTLYSIFWPCSMFRMCFDCLRFVFGFGFQGYLDVAQLCTGIESTLHLGESDPTQSL